MTFKPVVGAPCSFYHDGGHGDRYWVVGWRYGTIVAVPGKGHKLGWVQIELPVKRWEEVRKGPNHTWIRKPNERVWIFGAAVNAPGDCVYHGPKTQEVLAEREQQKAAEQAAADKRRAKGRVFHR